MYWKSFTMIPVVIQMLFGAWNQLCRENSGNTRVLCGLVAISIPCYQYVCWASLTFIDHSTNRPLWLPLVVTTFRLTQGGHGGKKLRRKAVSYRNLYFFTNTYHCCLNSHECLNSILNFLFFLLRIASICFYIHCFPPHVMFVEECFSVNSLNSCILCLLTVISISILLILLITWCRILRFA